MRPTINWTKIYTLNLVIIQTVLFAGHNHESTQVLGMNWEGANELEWLSLSFWVFLQIVGPGGAALWK